MNRMNEQILQTNFKLVTFIKVLYCCWSHPFRKNSVLPESFPVRAFDCIEVLIYNSFSLQIHNLQRRNWAEFFGNGSFYCWLRFASTFPSPNGDWEPFSV